MKYSEIEGLQAQELRKRLSVSKVNLFELKMKHSLGQLGSPMEIRQLRREIAQIKTALSVKLKR